MSEPTNTHTEHTFPTRRPHNRCGAGAIAAAVAAVAFTATACQYEDDATPCDLVSQAMSTVEQAGGVTNETMELTQKFLDAIQHTDDAILLHWGSYVGDAFRGSDPGSTLPYMLADVVKYCAGG